MERESKENEKKENVVTREELFITSKVWNDMYGEGQVEQACRQIGSSAGAVQDSAGSD